MMNAKNAITLIYVEVQSIEKEKGEKMSKLVIFIACFIMYCIGYAVGFSSGFDKGERHD